MGWKQIVCITTLALLVGQSESVNTTTTAQTTTGPPIHYNCSLNGEITINTTNLMATSHRIAIGQDKDESRVNYANANQNKCQYADSTPNNNKITLSGCNTSLPIYVYLMNQTSSDIVGGKNNHAYELNCYFPNEGIQRVVTVKNIRSLCVADGLHSYGGWFGYKRKKELLTDGKALDVNLLEDFNVTKKGSAVASMYAFRFQSSEVVRVTCNVTICKTMDCGGAYTPSPATRRRRSVEEAAAGRTYDVSAAFEILDNEPNESSSSSTLVRVNPLLIGLSLLCLWAGASRKTY